MHFSCTLFTGVRKDVDFEGGKVLLTNIGGKIHATPAFCSLWCTSRQLYAFVMPYPRYLVPLTIFISWRVFLSALVTSYGTSCHFAPQRIALTRESLTPLLDHPPILLMALNQHPYCRWVLARPVHGMGDASTSPLVISKMLLPPQRFTPSKPPSRIPKSASLPTHR